MLRIALPVTIALLLAACAGSDDDGSAGTSSSTSTSTTETLDEGGSTTSSSTSTTTSTTVAEALPDEIDRFDHLTLASGVIVSSFEGERGADSAGTATRAIDGAPIEIGFTVDDTRPAIYVFELPATTTFDRFAVPGVTDYPGNTTFFGSIEVAGSGTASDSGFEVLVSEDFLAPETDDGVVEFVPSEEIPVRWIRLTLSGALMIRPEDGVGNTVVRFTELIGNGTQEDQILSEGFTGVWDFRFADAAHLSGPLLELKQQGATLVGCVGPISLTGTVTGVVARLEGLDSRDDTPSVYLLTLSPEGELRGVESTNNGVFRARIGPVAPAGSTTPCSEIQPELPSCGSTVYVNFEVNSAEIRPDSAQVLADVFSGLQTEGETPVTIEGHTSTEGATDYNQDLSERRAQAVVDDLVEKGLDATRITAVGKGESEPLVSESDEASRALNRRVEILCG